MKYLAMVFISAFAYTLGGIYMKLAKGQFKIGANLVAYLCFIGGASLEALAMHHYTLGATYLL